MEKLFLRTAVINHGCLRQVHYSDHTSQMMGKKTPVLGGDRAWDEITRCLACCEASIDFIQTTIEVIAEQIPREIAVFKATIEDQSMTGFPTDRIVWPTESRRSHDVVNDMHQ